VIRASFEERYRVVVKDEIKPRATPGTAAFAGGILAVALVVAFVIARRRR
jgi:archaeosine-15-forming tRNA-guanine transglycosylase